MKNSKGYKEKKVSIWLAAIPLVTLVAMLAMTIKVYGADALNGGSQISLFVASSVATIIAICFCKCRWSDL